MIFQEEVLSLRFISWTALISASYLYLLISISISISISRELSR